MRLFPEEERFFRHWIYDEAHYEKGIGPAKRMQGQRHVRPADLAILIAAAIPDPADPHAASLDGTLAEPVTWPWSEELFRSRLAEARALLAEQPTSQPVKTALDR